MAIRGGSYAVANRLGYAPASEVVEAAHQGQALNEVDQRAFDQHPEFAGRLLINIPRLEGIAWIVAHQRPANAVGDGQIPENIRIGAAVLRVAVASADLTMQGMDYANALEKLTQDANLDQRAVQSLTTLATDTANMEYRTVRIEDLATGMVLQEEIRTTAGMLLVGSRTENHIPVGGAASKLSSTQIDQRFRAGPMSKIGRDPSLMSCVIRMPLRMHTQVLARGE